MYKTCVWNFMNEINICLASDNNYVCYASVLIASILLNANADDNLNIYILENGISDENKEKVLSLKRIKDFNIKFVSPDNNLFKPYLDIKTHAYLTMPAYYRLKLPSLLPDVDKIIYFDCDMVVNSSLKELFYSDLNGNYIGGVLDVRPFRMNRKSKLPLFNLYVNSGMLLIDLKKWREENVEEQFLNYAINNKEDIFCGDQQIINYVLQGKIKRLPNKWNVQSSNFMNRSSLMKYPNVIHYIAQHKPWEYASINYFKNYYFEYLSYTPFAMSPEEKYKYEVLGQRESIKKYIKRRPLFFLHPKFILAVICTYLNFSKRKKNY